MAILRVWDGNVLNIYIKYHILIHFNRDNNQS